MSSESQRILEAYHRYKNTGQGSLEETKQEIEEERVTARDVQLQSTESQLTNAKYSQQSNETKLQLAERELTEYDNQLRSSGKVSESELQKDPHHRQLMREVTTLQAQKQDNSAQINAHQDALSMYDVASEADRFFAGGISAQFSPFDSQSADRTPFTAPSLSPSQRAEKIGKTNTFLDPHFSVGDVYKKQDRTRLANAEQRLYVSQLRQGGISLADALINPRTKNSYYSDGKQIQKSDTSINTELFLSERGYDLSKPELIPNSIFKPEKQMDARRSTSGEMKSNKYPIASKEELAKRELVKQDHAIYQSEINAFRNVLHESDNIEKEIGVNTNQIYPQPNNQSQKQYGFEYNPLGQYAKGLTNTVRSYWNLGENVGNFITGNPQKPLSPTFTPIQDSFFGAVSKSISQSQDYGIPFDATFKQNFDNFYDVQSKRDKYTIAGELSLEAMLWAIPVSPIIKTGQYLVRIVPKFTGFGDNLTRVALEAGGSNPPIKMIDSDPFKKFPETYQNTNPMRKSIDKDIFALDNANGFKVSNIKLGTGVTKPQSVFKSTKIKLGKGIGTIKNNNKKGSGGGLPTNPKPPSPPSNPYSTSNGLQLLLRDPKNYKNSITKSRTVTKTKVKEEKV